MPRKSPPVMMLQVPVTKTMMELVAEASLYELDDYSDEDFRAAGVSRTRLIANLVNDVNFQAKVARQMVVSAQNGVRNDVEYGDISNGDHTLIKLALKDVQKSYDQREKTRLERQRNERIKDATALLREAGYKIVKA